MRFAVATTLLVALIARAFVLWAVEAYDSAPEQRWWVQSGASTEIPLTNNPSVGTVCVMNTNDDVHVIECERREMVVVMADGDWWVSSVQPDMLQVAMHPLDVDFFWDPESCGEAGCGFAAQELAALDRSLFMPENPGYIEDGRGRLAGDLEVEAARWVEGQVVSMRVRFAVSLAALGGQDRVLIPVNILERRAGVPDRGRGPEGRYNVRRISGATTRFEAADLIRAVACAWAAGIWMKPSDAVEIVREAHRRAECLERDYTLDGDTPVPEEQHPWRQWLAEWGTSTYRGSWSRRRRS